MTLSSARALQQSVAGGTAEDTEVSLERLRAAV